MNLLVSRKKLLGNAGGFLWSYGGYLIVSALCDLCGVVLNPKNARNFIADCIESLHDTLKANLSMNGTNYSLSLNDELVSEFIDFYLNVRKYEMGNSYVKSLEEYKSKYENEPSKIILDSSIVNIKTKWKKESTDIYISNGNVENLPSGVSIVYRKYLFKEGNECTDITGGWGKYYTDTHWYWDSANSKGGNVDNTIFLNMESGASNGALCSLGTNEKIDFSKYSKIGIEYSAVVDDIVGGAYIVFRLQIRDNYSGSEIQPSVRNWLLKSTGDLEIFAEAEFNLGNINEMLYLVPILISERWQKGSTKIKNIWLE